MKQELTQVFKNDKFGNIRVVLINNKEYFCASDIAKGLGYARPNDAVNQHCRATVKHRIIDSLGREQQVNFIPEGDIYRLITHSKLPQAEQFERWVFDEVLPSLRKHGAYMTDDTIEKALTEPDFLIRLATKLKEEKEARIKAEEEKKIIQLENEKNKKQLEAQEPKVAFANAITASKNSILVRELARLISQNGIEIGERRLYQWLRENRYVEKNSTKATQKAINLKVLELVERTNQDREGNFHTNFTTYVTPKGQAYFIGKFLDKKYMNC